MAEHDVSAFPVSEEVTILSGSIYYAYGREILSADHSKNLGEIGLGVHAVDDLLDLIKVLLGFRLLDGNGLLFTYLLDLIAYLLGSRHFENVTGLLVEFEV